VHAGPLPPAGKALISNYYYILGHERHTYQAPSLHAAITARLQRAMHHVRQGFHQFKVCLCGWAAWAWMQVLVCVRRWLTPRVVTGCSLPPLAPCWLLLHLLLALAQSDLAPLPKVLRDAERKQQQEQLEQAAAAAGDGGDSSSAQPGQPVPAAAAAAKPVPVAEVLTEHEQEHWVKTDNIIMSVLRK
jgi:hypothetical protein